MPTSPAVCMCATANAEECITFFSSGSKINFMKRLVKNDELKIQTIRSPSWVRCMAISATSDHLIVSTNCKKLQIYEIGTNLTLKASIEVYKRITCITYSDDGCVLFGDKTGRAYQWTVEQQAAARNLFTKPLEEQSKEEINSTQPNLMLGHCSLVTDIVYDKDNHFVITSDKDYKIRVNTYPQYYNIEMFLLGHTEYVSKMLLNDNKLISGSGDGTIRIWDLKEGKEIVNTEIVDCVDSKSASHPLLFTDDKVLCSRGNKLFVMSHGLEVKQELDVGQCILDVCLFSGLLICSLAKEPYFVGYQWTISGLLPIPEEHPQLELVASFTSLLDQISEETEEEITEELFGLEKRRKENIKSFFGPRNTKRQKVDNE